MALVFSRTTMRILLRQQESLLYLQPSGVWKSNRASARDFLSTMAAYWWAFEQHLFGTEVLLALKHAQRDIVVLKLRQPGNRTTIDCRAREWSHVLHASLFKGTEVDLVNFNSRSHGHSAALIAQAFEPEFEMASETGSDRAHFRRKSPHSSSFPR